MPRLNPATARNNEETLREARELGPLARIEIVEAAGDEPQHRCAAADAVRERRFAVEEVPSLPLPGCTAEDCECTYVLGTSDAI
ncbi:MAG TPA: hypothetical protein VGB88_14570 [Alphaproteobacteria bacterium]